MQIEENFGQRMSRVKREQGITTPGPGRPRIADKYKKQIAATEQTFAVSMPTEAQRYIDNLAPQEPEECGVHKRVLRCPAYGCNVQSERVPYNHRAAAYVFDRVMGKPTSRTEATVAVRLVDDLVGAIVMIFGEVNDLSDATARQQAFAERCFALQSELAGTAA